MDEHEQEPPRGAFVLMLLFLVLLTIFWLNIYLTVWRRG